MNKLLTFLMLLFAWMSAQADVVHVYTAKNVGGTETMLSDAMRNTGETFSTIAAPVVDGYIFTGWTINASQALTSRDVWGRSLDVVSFTVYEETTVVANYVANSVDADSDGVPDGSECYWFGNLVQNAGSDSDDDGYGLAVELSLGLNPLMPDRSVAPGVVTAAGSTVEVNLQIYEQPHGALVGDAYEQFFTSPLTGNAATSRTFANGAQIWPVVADVNADGLWDLIVCSATATNVFVNTGTKGNPQFEESGGRGATALPDDDVVGRAALCPPTVDLDMNSTAKLAGMTLDVAPINALSATTNGTTLLVSDEEGRIWLYEGTEATEGTEGTTATNNFLLHPSSFFLLPSSFFLQHKVWGGSYAGFANGLMLAAVDWEDDGDLDCLCGTADGKLILLRDPMVGRPSGLTAAAGVDNVKLDWEPNGQSRVRGYRVYKATKATEGTEGTTPASTGDSTGEGDSSLLSFGSFKSLTQTLLPHYRDLDLAPATYAYKVSALSRFYTAGNSTPTETESVVSEPVAVTVGGVRFFWNDAVYKIGETAVVMLSIENALNFNVTGRVQVVSYDPAYLEPVEPIPSGLAEKIKCTSSFADGQWTITLTEGVLPAGSGKFFTLVFRTLKAGTTRVCGGRGATALPTDETAGATVTIASAPTYQLGDVNGDGMVDVLDLRLLAKLNSAAGRKYTSDQLRAGDFNGNGKLDNADYQLLRELLKKLGVLK